MQKVVVQKWFTVEWFLSKPENRNELILIKWTFYGFMVWTRRTISLCFLLSLTQTRVKIGAILNRFMGLICFLWLLHASSISSRRYSKKLGGDGRHNFTDKLVIFLSQVHIPHYHFKIKKLQNEKHNTSLIQHLKSSKCQAFELLMLKILMFRSGPKLMIKIVHFQSSIDFVISKNVFISNLRTIPSLLSTSNAI